MSQLLKRLEIIKYAIAVEDDDTINIQVRKIKAVENEPEIFLILDLIESDNYETVIELIDQYLADHKALMVYDNPRVQGLKLELKILENELNTSHIEFAKYENQIREFNVQYHLHLGELIQSILFLRQQILSADADESVEHQEKFDEAIHDYEHFRTDSERKREEKPAYLNSKSEKKLRELFKKAAKKCHPDIVDVAFVQEAEKMFKELNTAYRKKDLQKVEQIYITLERTKGFAVSSETIANEDILRSKIQEINEKIQLTKTKIKRLMQSDTYERISRLDNWDEYFLDLRSQLLEEYEQLMTQLEK